MRGEKIILERAHKHIVLVCMHIHDNSNWTEKKKTERFVAENGDKESGVCAHEIEKRLGQFFDVHLQIRLNKVESCQYDTRISLFSAPSMSFMLGIANFYHHRRRRSINFWSFIIAMKKPSNSRHNDGNGNDNRTIPSGIPTNESTIKIFIARELSDGKQMSEWVEIFSLSHSLDEAKSRLYYFP